MRSRFASKAQHSYVFRVIYSECRKGKGGKRFVIRDLRDFAVKKEQLMIRNEILHVSASCLSIFYTRKGKGGKAMQSLYTTGRQGWITPLLDYS